jgi:hypothetical protein
MAMHDFLRFVSVFTVVAIACGDDGGADGAETAAVDDTGSASAGTGPQPPAPGEPGKCVPGCEADDDCTFGTLACKNGACVLPSCNDVGCQQMGYPDAYVCIPKGSRWTCVEGCADDGTCASSATACVGMAEDGTPYCMLDLTCDTDADCAEDWSCHPIDGVDQCMPACSTDAECENATVCVPLADDGAGLCQQPLCATDDDCDGGHCEDHACTCAASSECAGSDVCIAAD